MPTARVFGSLLLLLGLVLSGCIASAPTSGTGDARLVGEASYYADKYAGRTTASGDVYDPSAMTAAHKSLPFGTRVRVTRLDTGASVTVRINDRGPFKNGRIIDLSKAAARRLDMMRVGVTEVRLEILNRSATPRSTPDPPRTGRGW